MRKSIQRNLLTVLAIVLTLAAAPVLAQETVGSLKGSVADDVGTPVAGAILEAIGPMGTLSTTSDVDGNYRFPRLPAGNYKITAKYVGFLDATTDIRVILGEAMSVNFSLQKTFSEEIMVYSDTVAIDFTESATTTSIREWEIDYLPRGRDFTDVASFGAGATVEHMGGGIMIDGASGLENRFVIDGLDTTDPQIGENAVPLRAEMMEEVQVKSAGYMAEYGGAMGGVINAVTKSGGNEFHGSLFVDLENNSWNGSQRAEIELDLDDPTLAYLETYRKDDEKRYDPGFSIGGPIVRDRLWFFASYIPGIRTTERYVDWTSYEPQIYTQDYNVDFVTANLTANISSSLLLKAGVNMSPYTREGDLPNPDGRLDLPDQENWAPIGDEGERETYFLNADWIASDNFIVSGRIGYFKTNAEDTGIPYSGLKHNYAGISGFLDRYPEIPSQWQQNVGWMSALHANANSFDTYERTQGSIDATWYFSGGGEHSLKFGYQNEQIANDVQSGYNGDRLIYYWDQGYTTTASVHEQGTYGVMRLLNISTLGQVETNNQAIFIQDNWTVTPNLTLNIGIRSENEAIPNFGPTGNDPAIEFDWGEKLAPRLGFAWDIKGDAKWKLYGSAGKYFDVTKYEMPRGSFGGDKWVDYWFTFDTADPGLNDASTCNVGNNTFLDRPVCGAGTFIEANDRRGNSADPALAGLTGIPGIDPNIKPMENYELQMGLDHQLTSTTQIGVRVVHKEIKRAIEDVGVLVEGVGEVYTIANPGEGVTAGVNEDGMAFPKPVREYDAVEFTFDRRFSDNWSLRAYYTLSNLNGNYSGLANSDEWSLWSPRQAWGGRRSPNVSRLYDTVLGYYDQNGDFVYGDLPTDRTHQFGAQFLYSFPIGFNIGVNQYVGSGTPLTTVGTVPSGNEFYPFGRGDLGRTGWLTQTDLNLNYTFTFGRGLAFKVGVTVLNLFDQEAVTSVYPNTAREDVNVTPADILAGYDYAALLAGMGPQALDVRYGMDNGYQRPREVRLTLKFEF